MSKPVNSNCILKLTIVEAKFIKDADFFGKQDPLMKWKHNGREYKTTTKDDAGKHAIWNETFELDALEIAVKGSPFILASYDSDPTGVEWLGEIKGLQYKDLCSDAAEKKHDLDMFDKKDKKSGNVVFST
jgi:hypothetical protein